MEFWSNGVNVLKLVITLFGAAMLVFGIIEILVAFAQDAPAKKTQGIGFTIAGGGIIVVAQALIPLLGKMASF
ncbi:MAG: conjugal transfer protein [Clostridiales bacterium]|nr:conjugal transfer protein [Clostridiales bacterium]MBS5877848.1 conjugal transfer protein [Clostridiales bacterium]